MWEHDAMTEAPMASAPRKRVRDAKEGAYTRFLEWASLNMPGAWRLRLDILLVSYVALFLAAFSAPVIFAWAAGPDDQGYACQSFRGAGDAEVAAAPVGPVFSTIEEARDYAQTTQSNAQYYAELASAQEAKALAPGASQDVIDRAQYARQDANYYAEEARKAAEALRFMEAGVDPAAAEAAQAPQGLGFDSDRPCAGRAYHSGNLPRRLKIGHQSDNSGNIYFTQGFNSGEQGWILAGFILVALGLSLSWAFLVARGTRLRDVVVRTNAPGFVPLALGLLPFVLLPMFAGFMTFAASHGFSLGSMFLGETDISADGTGFKLYFPSSGYGSSTRDLLITFGVVIAGFVAISLKVVIYDGVVGLIRAIAIAGVMGAVTFFSAFGAYSLRSISGAGGSYEWAAGVTLAWGAVYVLAFLKDVPAGVRRRTTRPIALSFPFYMMGWLLQLFAFMSSAGHMYWITSNDLLLILLVVSVLALVVSSLVFSFVARISLWPRPN
jgi:hypothetical protein